MEDLPFLVDLRSLVKSINRSHWGYRPYPARRCPIKTKNTPRINFDSKIISTTFNVLILILCSISISLTTVEAFCPNRCTCDVVLLEVTCHEPIGLKGVPITLNPQTKRIFIKNNNLTTFHNIEIYRDLEGLDLSHNNINLLNLEKLETNAHLKTFNASHNTISEFTDTGLKNSETQPSLEGYAIPVLPSKRLNIRILMLDHNQIQIINDFLFFRLPHMETLDLSYNKIQIINDLAFIGAHNLEKLILRGNMITQVPTVPISFLGYDIVSRSILQQQYPSNLKILDLSQNNFSILPSSSFMALVFLQELYLEACNINDIEDGAFDKLDKLLLLSLDKNYLRIIPTTALSHLSSLRVLQVNQNSFSELPSLAFSNLINLEDLQLNNLSLNTINKDSFYGLSNLRRLEISSNVNLSNIEQGALSNLTRLNYLNLNSNALTGISGDLANSTHLKLFDLRNNPLNCQCNLRWLSNWLRLFDMKTSTYQNRTSPNNPSESILEISGASQYLNVLEPEELEYASWLNDSILTRDLVDLRCAKPAALANQLLINMHLDKLECLEPSSELHVQLGIGALLVILTLMMLICLISFFLRRKDFLIVLKKNIIQRQTNRSMMPDFDQDKPKPFDDLKNSSTIFTINTGAHNMYDTNLSYGEINDYSSAIYDDRHYHEPDIAITRTYTDL